ncbi:MAG: cytochrome c3 family protein [Planctomycetota bacterium]
MKLIRWLLPIASLACVLLFTLWDMRRASTGPGPLHASHTAVAALEQGTKCEACHRSGAGVDAKACMQCHAAIGAQAAARTGLHGSLSAEQLARCETCHSEHHGSSVPLIAPHAFARAGIADVAAYDHRHVQFHLNGAHSKLACVNCHNQADSVEPSVPARYLGLSQSCATCHEDVHRSAFGKDCESCHGQEQPFSAVPKFPHTVFALSGAHARVACAACHEPESAHDVATLRQQPVAARECVACHANPHDAAPAAKVLHLRDAQDCARCHAATRWNEARPTADAHAAYGFALRGAHATADCAACHGNAARAPRWSGPSPELAACSACHEHPHGPALMAAATAVQGPAAGCADCHADADAHFAQGRMNAAQHAASGFTLTAPHGDLACGACHLGTQRSERFPGRAPEDCRGCHRDVHGGQFPAAQFAQCTDCHATTHFMPHGFGTAAHAKTKFPLTGAHDAVGCAACHREVKDGGRTFHGTAGECAACHTDVHAGLFDRKGRPARVGGRQGCARCHDTAAFEPVVADFDHELWTGYELASSHARLVCNKCHAVGTGGPQSPRLGKVNGTTCNACHQDAHAGQFALGGATDCACCHTASAWPELHFDHQRQSRFALDGLHEKLACAKCHLGYTVGTSTLVRYKPLGTACGDCHRLGSAGKVLK